MEIHRAGIFNNKLLHSLSTIQAAKTHLRLLTTSSSAPTVLVSQINLCDVLLGEIRAIRSSLEGRLRHQVSDGQGAVAAKLNGSSGEASPARLSGKSLGLGKIADAACEDSGLVNASGKAVR